MFSFIFQEDAISQLELLENEIQASNAELARVKQLYDSQAREEENLTRGYVAILECLP